MLIFGLGFWGREVGQAFASPSSPPVNTVLPVVSGSFFVGQALSCSTGTWEGSGISYSYQWRNAGTNISGATSAAYTVQPGDDGDLIDCVVTATNSEGSASEESSGLYAILSDLWVDASDLSSVSHIGGSVSAWADKSGNGNDAAQGIGTSQPVTGTRTINSLNALDFDGTNDQLSLPVGLYGNLGSSPQTTFIVYQSDDAGGSSQRLLTGQVAGLLRYGNYISLTLFRAVNRSSLLPTDFSAPRNTAVHIGGHVRSGASLIPHYDGVAGSNANNSEDISLTSMSIGDGAVPGTSPFDGLIGEAIVCKRALSTAEINQIGLYLANKWGGTWIGL